MLKLFFMKLVKKCARTVLCLLAILIATSGHLIMAQVSATATGHIYAEIIPVFSANEVSQMFFGKFSPGATGGEVILTPESTISVLGDIYAGSGTHNAAIFCISGDNSVTYSISLPTEPATLTNTASSKTMVVNNWVSVPESGIGEGNLENGSQMVYVGATLTVGTIEDNPPGLYSGTYKITFDFN